MEYFITGFFVGMIIEFLLVLYITVKDPEIEEECSDDPEKLVAELRAMRVVTGLCRKEKEILDQSADYIEKGIQISTIDANNISCGAINANNIRGFENDRDKHSSNE